MNTIQGLPETCTALILYVKVGKKNMSCGIEDSVGFHDHRKTANGISISPFYRGISSTPELLEPGLRPRTPLYCGDELM